MKSVLFSSVNTLNLFSYFKHRIQRKHEDLIYFRRYKELLKIIKNESLQTYFQPIVNIQNGDTFAFEALNRPLQSVLFENTDHFYEFVGQTNIVFPFEQFCRNISLKRFTERLTFQKDQNFNLFINIHPHVLLDKNYHSGETFKFIKELGIQPEQVVFELTERSAVTDFNEFKRVLSHYRKQGYRIAIDDVGSGYNSLKTLIYLKPEFIKLDRSLIQNIDLNEAGQSLVSLIHDYAEQSQTKIIAEGIERLEELNYLQSVGIQYAQGYALGRPNQEIKLGSIPKF
ncbi:EAL domain-containing protein [Ureibacillus acetophenoni]|uniref:EAL domain-containing protein (Putative c-di-GMP-specific phosphodiesterase class I) n=1 Tax=Ureibacillus acetophenoni TaxID=614649 RepID=A0A285UMK8_9BACL|nr:EAL domain-containing protein [Ureibacillus acetophenoni]SOC41856.1 EAL domain-containing protein (putative c-di-GMP-specific phosphodiesterase class I) [Ureibacillus acetophenoni]